MKQNIPNHVAVIPDGNRRWASGRGLRPWDGHEEGAKNLEKIIKKAFNLGIKNMSFWGSSLDNLKKRPLREKKALLDIYLRYFERLLYNQDIHKNQARVNVIGRWEEQFPDSLQEIIEKCIKQTRNYKKYTLNFFLAYSGDDEIIEMAKKIAEKYKSKENITRKTIKENLMTKDLPEVDYVIRTGGEPHLSAGFLMWDTANAQLYFSDVLFPDFGSGEFAKAIKEYQRRERRLGK